MRIDPARCTGCGKCIPYCPAVAIFENADGVHDVSQAACFECGLCRHEHVCPAGAFVESGETTRWPRCMRSLFSDPNTTHQTTMTPGRGTEESKTNDVTGRVRRGDIGLCIELGRPGTGCTLGDVSSMTERLGAIGGVRFSPGNPLVSIMNAGTNRLAVDLLADRILSAIIEIVFDEGSLDRVLGEIFDAGAQLNTVFSLSLIARFGKDGDLPIIDRLAALGLAPTGSAKVNMGLGSPPVGGDE